MPTLWFKGLSPDALTQAYCAGSDWELDNELLPFDL
jgi:hypothetical protein